MSEWIDSASIRFTRSPPQKVGGFVIAEEWDRCAPWLQAALDKAGNTHSLDDVRARVDAGTAHFWALPQGAVVTAFVQYPCLKALDIWLVGGEDLMAMLKLLPILEQWGREEGCRRVQGDGRMDWARVAGFRVASVNLVKEL